MQAKASSNRCLVLLILSLSPLDEFDPSISSRFSVLFHFRLNDVQLQVNCSFLSSQRPLHTFSIYDRSPVHQLDAALCITGTYVRPSMILTKGERIKKAFYDCSFVDMEELIDVRRTTKVGGYHLPHVKFSMALPFYSIYFNDKVGLVRENLYIGVYERDEYTTTRYRYEYHTDDVRRRNNRNH